MKIIPLHQGIFSVGADKRFHKIDEPSTANATMTVAIQPFVVKCKNDYILLDAGLAGHYLKSEKPDLVFLLEREKMAVEDITIIIISHFHKDHFSGLFNPNSGALIFPNAAYYVYEKDINDCIHSHRYPKYTEVLKRFIELPNVHLLSNEDGNIRPHIRYQHTEGHMPYHIVCWIEDEGSIIFYGGDESPELKQMQMNITAKYDHNGKQANEYRKQWFKEGKTHHWTALFYHDIKTPIVRLGEL